MLIHRPDIVDYISVRIRPENAANTLEFLENTWYDVIPNASFGYYFLDNTFEELYAQEECLSNAILAFSLVAIFLACLGLFGLSLFMAERRTKEIGVRKVMGASIWDILKLITSDITRLILIALGFALPGTYLMMEGWLQDFAYRIEMSWWLFALGAFLVVAVSWLTVSWHSVRVATINPVHSLRSE